MRLVNRAFWFLFLIMFLAPMPSLAQEPSPCESDYFVQPSDSLLKIAERYYGDSSVYPSIVKATNDKAATDSAYATIDNPSVIRPGWKLCLPVIGGKAPKPVEADLSADILTNGQSPQEAGEMAVSVTEAESARSEDRFTPEDVTFRAETLTSNVAGVTIPATPYDTSSPTGHPDYVAFLFDGEERLRILPVKAYENLWNSAGDPTISNNINQLRITLVNRPELPQNPLPFLPPATGYNDLAVQKLFLDFTGGSGIRFVGRFSQGVRPVVSSELQYVFQGLTDDGNYYISFEYPISTAALPADATMISPAEQQKAVGNFQDYLTEIEGILNGLNPTDFTPDLAQLDALIKSIAITQPLSTQAPSDTLVGITWKLQEIQEMNDNTIIIDDPEKYTLELDPSGKVDIRADCNYGRGSYEIREQQLSIEVNSLTKAMCPLDSLSEMYIRLLNEATSYVIRDKDLFISYGIDSGILKFSN